MSLPGDHFLSQGRLEPFAPHVPGVVDTTTLAAHDFDVDTRTGFMPPDPPLVRLPVFWEVWEQALDDAIQRRLQLGTKVGVSEDDRLVAERWREQVRMMPVLPTDSLKLSELTLRRAHHVLAWIMHFYIHSQPPSTETPRPAIHIPAPISVPLLSVSRDLSLPPLLTYSDDVLYNWALKEPSGSMPTTLFSSSPYDDLIPISDFHPNPSTTLPTPENIRAVTLFTSTNDEAEFYLVSARIELAGVAALSLMEAIMGEAFVDDTLAHKRITAFLLRLAPTIDRLTALLATVREGCDPTVFYDEVRPWFKGEDSNVEEGGKWVFDGLEDYPELGLEQPTELSGPSAGQSSLIHALDVFLGVDHFSHTLDANAHVPPMILEAQQQQQQQQAAFLERMQLYMPRHHRQFLRHLSANPKPLRTLVQAASSSYPAILEAYNAAVGALKRFRDAHMRIVALYIINPARRATVATAVSAFVEGDEQEGVLRGTGGTNLVRFLKGVRDRTASAVLSPESTLTNAA